MLRCDVQQYVSLNYLLSKYQLLNPLNSMLHSVTSGWPVLQTHTEMAERSIRLATWWNYRRLGGSQVVWMRQGWRDWQNWYRTQRERERDGEEARRFAPRVEQEERSLETTAARFDMTSPDLLHMDYSCLHALSACRASRIFDARRFQTAGYPSHMLSHRRWKKKQLHVAFVWRLVG